MPSSSYAHADANSESHANHGRSAYLWFGAQMLISGVAMYLAMYLMIDRLEHFHVNLNTLYMTLAMLAPMGVAMLALMPSMYRNRRLNLVLYGVLAVLLLIGIWFTRAQILIGDTEFLRSMIPHHSGAILMCEETPISDGEIAELCTRIIQSQSEEIAQMERILERL